MAEHYGMVGSDDLTGMSTYRVYAVLENSDDIISALIGDEEHPGFFSTSTSFFQHSIGSVTPSGINPAFYPAFPSLEFDSWITIGIDRSPQAGEGTISILEEDSEPWTAPFENGGNIDLTGILGGGWYTFTNYTNAHAGEDLEVLIGQFTTSGSLEGQIYMQVFIHGDQENEIRTLVNLADACGAGSLDNCIYSEENFDCDGICILDENENGICDLDELGGCTSSLACNYDATATEDDGSCDFISCITFGCSDDLACNYDASADYDDGTCEYANFPYNCSGECIADDDGDGVCDSFEIFGCDDPTACNYSSGVTNADDSCTYDCYGCTDPSACNFDSTAVFNDVSCDFTSCMNIGCTDDTACNFNAESEYDDGSCEYEGCSGCTSEFACNYDSTSLIDDGSCEFLSCLTMGCTDENACNFDNAADYDDGSCEYTSCLGCTNDIACNYDPEALYDDGTCDLPVAPYNCDGSCMNDEDGDGVCDENETLGCDDLTACNYDENASENDGSCDYCSCAETNNNTVDGYGLVIETVATHTSGELAGMTTYRLYISTPNDDDYLSAVFGDDEYPLHINTSTSFYQHIYGSVLGSDMIPDIYPVFPELQYDSWVTIGLDSSPEAGEMAPQIIESTEMSWTSQFEAGGNIDISDVIGGSWFSLDPSGTANAYSDADSRILITQLTTDGDLSGTIHAQLFNNGSQEDVSRVEFSINGSTGGGSNSLCGCMDTTACNYDSEAVYDNETCNFDSCTGCTSVFACNYDSEATIDNGSCDFVSCIVFGCVDPNSCNYDPEADYDDGSCTYADFPYDCDGECVNDADGDGLCDEFEIPGCTDSLACNYASGATEEDGSCNYVTCAGCTSPVACNFDPSASIDDGSCDFISCIVFGCTDTLACNYDTDADYDDGSCDYADFPYDCYGECVNDIDGDGICNEYEIPGCTDTNACNYSSSATDENGSCEYISCLVFGCMDTEACNYNAEAQFDDGTCVYIQVGFCDCDGNQLDALGVCGGDCAADVDSDGVCDSDEIYGCDDSMACNYDSIATENDGTCDYCSCSDAGTEGYSLEIEVIAEHTSGELAGTTTYRLYISTPHNDDFLSAIYGDDESPLHINTSTSFYQHIYGSVLGSDMIPDIYPVFPKLQYDSWVTIGLDSGPEAGEMAAQLIESTVFSWVSQFESGGNIDMDDSVGSSWFVLDPGSTSNALPDVDQRILIGQFTTDGVLSGTIFAQFFNHGSQEDVSRFGFIIGADTSSTNACGCKDVEACNYDSEADYDNDTCEFTSCAGCTSEFACNYNPDSTIDDGSCDFVSCIVFGCTDTTACNYDPDADYDDGSCDFADFPYDCDGECVNDTDGDGICNEYEIPGCTDTNACNYSSTATDEDGSCDYTSCLVFGCMDSEACNYNAEAQFDDGTCVYIQVGFCDCDGNQLDAIGVCGGSCTADIDSDEICDDVDDCVGALDECGVCNGDGAVYECGCDDIPAGDCDCSGNQLDALGVCGGSCEADIDSDGICDDVDDCVGALDECGVCNGDGAVYECGCIDIPSGDCDCDGNQLDALGVCGGSCTADIDSDGICDDVDDCVGALDECGVCNGDGAVYECGCDDIPAGDCDCNGNQLDALGVCGGACSADIDSDGICDDVDDCVGALDECGVCNGDGAVYECGCDDIPAGDCDCDGNQLDSIGVCGGDCEEDVNENNICDIDEYGCTDPANPNFDPSAAFDDGACLTGGCTIMIACNYDPEAEFLEAGSCDFISCSGCTNPTACNYDSDATLDDNTCEGPEYGYNCDSSCLNDTDGDGVCDEFEVLGCTDPSNPGYEPEATEDDGSCQVGGCIHPLACNYDSSADYMIITMCEFSSCIGCMDEEACNYDAEATLSNIFMCEYPPNSSVNCDGSCTNDIDEDGICDEEDACIGAIDACGVCNGPGAIYECGCSDVPQGDCDCDGSQLDELGICGGECSADIDNDGICDDVDECVGLYDTCGVCNGEGIPDNQCDCDGNIDDAIGICGGSCEADINDNGICDTDEYGCTDPTNPNYDPDAAFDDGSCVSGGCTVLFACNYDPEAAYQVPGSCDFDSCSGCTDSIACNYDEEATINDSSCEFAVSGYDCAGICLNDSDGDGVCDEYEVSGCTDPGSPNFNPGATDDDGSCLVGGCIHPLACNYDSDADFMLIQLCDFSSCVGCTDVTACTYDDNATINDQSLCEYPETIMVDCNGTCLNDADGDGVCDENEIPGCTDPTASNYNQDATDDNGTCVPPLVGGCIIPFACNYDPGADYYIPGSCVFGPCDGAPQSDYCYEPNSCNYGDFSQCEFESCLALGCDDNEACNYDSSALYNDGSCEYEFDCDDVIPGSTSEIDDIITDETLIISAYAPALSNSIVINGLKNCTVAVYSLNGKLISQESVMEGSINIVSLPVNGIYLVRATMMHNGKVQTIKLFTY